MRWTPVRISIDAIRAAAVLALLVTAGKVEAGRAIPDDNLGYPVLVTLKSGAGGSGFFVNGRTSMYFVTAKHVLIDSAKEKAPLLAEEADLISYSKDPRDATQNHVTLNLKTLDAAGEVKRHPFRDVVVVRLANLAPSKAGIEVRPLVGVTINHSAPSGFLGVSLDSLTRFDDVLVSNEVFVSGYPTSLGLKAIPQLDFMRPLLRKGIVAGLNVAQKTIVLDCPVYPGNSGGPVLETDEESLGARRFRVIGVVSEFVPSVETWVNVAHNYSNVTILNSGYSIATPIDFVIELLGADAQQPVSEPKR